MSVEIYKKENGKYVYIGQEWTGFPADGIWHVKDGSQGLVFKTDYEEELPFLPILHSRRDECASYIISQLESAGKEGYTFYQIATYASEFYGNLITTENHPEAFL